MNKPSSYQNFIILFFISCLTYFFSFKNGFVVDDFLFATPKYHGVFASFSDYFTKTKSQHYQPVFYLLNVPTFKLFGSNYILYRLMNMFLVYGVGCSIYHLINKLTNRKLVALLAALLWIVHPLTANSVNQITHNYLFVCAGSIIWSILFYLEFLDQRKFYYCLLSSLMFGLGLLCMEAAALTPVYLAAVLIIFKRQSALQVIKNLTAFIIVFFGFLLAWYSVAYKGLFVEHSREFLDINPISYVSGYSHLLLWYLKNLFLPLDIVYSYNLSPTANYITIVLFLLVLVFFCYIWKLFKGRNDFKLAFIWFVAGLIYVVPGLLTHPYMGMVLSPHWLLIPSIGLYWMIALGMIELKSRLRPGFWRTTLAGVLLYFIIFTQGYHAIAKTEKSFTQFWVTVCPNNVIALNKLAVNLHNERRYGEALELFERILRSDWHKKGLIYANMASTYIELGNLDAAETYAKKSLAGPYGGLYAYNAYYTLGLVSIDRKNYEIAEQYFLKSYKVHPKYLLSIYNLSDIYILQNANEKGIKFLSEVLQNNPPAADRIVILARLAGHFSRENQVDEAFERIEKIIMISPSFETFESVSKILDEMGQKEFAEKIMHSGYQTYPERIPRLNR